MARKKLDKEVRKAIYTVILNNGEKINHTYDIPLDNDEAEKLADSITKMIVNAMKYGKNWLFWFDNPLICYNIDNVSGICVDTLESEEVHEIIKKSQEKLGFVKQ